MASCTLMSSVHGVSYLSCKPSVSFLCSIFASSLSEISYIYKKNRELNRCSVCRIARFVLQHYADGGQMHQTAVAYMKQENRGNALQAESLVMAFNKLFS